MEVSRGSTPLLILASLILPDSDKRRQSIAAYSVRVSSFSIICLIVVEESRKTISDIIGAKIAFGGIA